jgi:lantibiotic modifying enzyme
MSASCDSSAPFLHAAAGIGWVLCERAYWDRGGRLCNWIGRSPAELGRDGVSLTPTASALGPELYGGSAGIALFLAQLFSLTGEASLRRTALAAMARSARQLDLRPEPVASPLSFYNGHLGIAFAADRIAALTSHEEPAALAEALLDRVAAALTTPHLLDVMGGNAGAIPPLLAMGRRPGRTRCLDLALALGEELLEKAERREAYWVWDTQIASGPDFGSIPLAGLSHGAAGIGLALLELHGASGRTDVLEAALGAFAYEDSLFDPSHGNWPDLRADDTPGGSARPPSYALSTWCHGAPGIALSRLRAAALDPARRAAHAHTARTAIATTLRAIETNLANPRHDATLCHGLAGLAEIVLIAGQLLGEKAYLDAAAATAGALIDRHAKAGDWPSGVASGRFNPSLMLGTAGIGYTFLRLHSPALVPPVLLLIP